MICRKRAPGNSSAYSAGAIRSEEDPDGTRPVRPHDVGTASRGLKRMTIRIFAFGFSGAIAGPTRNPRRAGTANPKSMRCPTWRAPSGVPDGTPRLLSYDSFAALQCLRQPAVHANLQHFQRQRAAAEQSVVKSAHVEVITERLLCLAPLAPASSTDRFCRPVPAQAMRCIGRSR